MPFQRIGLLEELFNTRAAAEEKPLDGMRREAGRKELPELCAPEAAVEQSLSDVLSVCEGLRFSESIDRIEAGVEQREELPPPLLAARVEEEAAVGSMGNAAAAAEDGQSAGPEALELVGAAELAGLPPKEKEGRFRWKRFTARRKESSKPLRLEEGSTKRQRAVKQGMLSWTAEQEVSPSTVRVPSTMPLRSSAFSKMTSGWLMTFFQFSSSSDSTRMRRTELASDTPAKGPSSSHTCSKVIDPPHTSTSKPTLTMR
jgi:hypothetical protein